MLETTDRANSDRATALLELTERIRCARDNSARLIADAGRIKRDISIRRLRAAVRDPSGVSPPDMPGPATPELADVPLAGMAFIPAEIMSYWERSGGRGA
jgi:hypothetical protein